MGEIGPDAGAEFRIEEDEPRQDTVVVSPYGEADLHVANQLAHRMLSAIDRARAVILDLSGVSFVDSTALGVVVRGMKKAREEGGQLRVVAPTDELRRIFEITLLDRVIALDPSLEAALAATAPGAGDLESRLDRRMDGEQRIHGGDLEDAQDARVGGHER